MTKEIKKIGGGYRNLVFGLKKLPPDNRDFKLSAILKLPPLEELPEEFELEPIIIYDQLSSDYCTAEATCGARGIQEGIVLSPEWSFAVSKMISGDPEEPGQDLRTAMKVHTKYGAIEKSEAPYSIQDTEDSVIRYISNWPKGLFEKAKKHQAQSFFKLGGQYDHFDDIRAYLWMKKALKQAITLGTEWSWPIEMKIMETFEENGAGHAIYARGWKKIDGKTYLIIQNSYGKEAGDNGSHYFSREVINKFADKYGDFVLVDMPPEQAKKLVWSKCQRLIEAIKKLFVIK